ncbi:Ig-like domain-containing protein [Streptomyces sp. NRRL B-24484]|uniref:Ig-like domain-containing protein n=1 Tax=Streptomyces sp. NRRL B-24484 TaxID=1463833 RepID=UPI0004BFB093|nr:Ig-like domain-containing protein [Streptomyces sp. NRRL B-24484]
MNRRFRPTSPARRVLAAAAAAGLLLPAVLTGPAGAQQSPAAWNQDRTAVLPSGLTVRLDFSPLPGITATAAPGTLAGPAGSSTVYADGMRPGDPAETVDIGADRAAADGSWRTLGTLRLAFSRPVRNPRLHVGGLAARAAAATGTTATAVRLTATGGTPSTPTLTGRTPWTGWTAAGGELAPPADTPADTAGDGTGTGTLELTGTVGTVTLRLEQRTTARDGSTTPPPALRTSWTVTLDESLGTAPQGYGNASHLLSDLYLGRDATDDRHRERSAAATAVRPLVAGPGGTAAAGATSGDAAPGAGLPGAVASGDTEQPAAPTRPLVELVPSLPRSLWASPVAPRTGPGRGEYPGADPTLAFPAEAATGDYYRVDVPVAPGSGPAVLAGWVDFDRNGRFDPLERVQTEVPQGATTARLEWAVTGKVVAGETWARLRLARDASQLVTPGGFADSGQVLDQRIRLAAGSARPEVSAPVDGTVTAEVRPQVAGAAPAGASVVVADGDRTLCTAAAAQDGAWTCRPGEALADGEHALTAVATARSGAALRSEPVRLTVKTAPPAAPALTLPEYTNDPGLLVTGTGEPGSTVSVTEAGGTPRAAGELCSTGIGPDGAWSCLPVESFDDGVHRLTATAADAAGNTARGTETALTVDTAAPARPVLETPKAGAAVDARPRLAGRAEAAATVTVAAGPKTGGGERTALCSGVAGADGVWSCTAERPAPAGERVLVATATDRAGNSTAGEPVAVQVAAETSPSAAAVSPQPGSSAAASPPVAAEPTGPSPSAAGPAAGDPPSADPGAPSAGDGPEPSGRVRAVPPQAGHPAARRSAFADGRALGAHGSLLPGLAGVACLAAAGLLLRRVFARGPGSRRRY